MGYSAVAKVHARSIITSSGCVEWLGSTNGKGYGKVWDAEERRLRPTHRVTYEFYIGPVPDSLVLDHLCRNRLCVNVSHLEAVTNAENGRRGNIRFNGKNNSKKTHCPKNHPYAGENLIVEKNGQRRCRTCDNARRRKGMES